MPDHPTTSAERLRDHELPGRADADIRPTTERYFPLDNPIAAEAFDGSKLPTYVGLPEPTVDELMAGPVATYDAECHTLGDGSCDAQGTCMHTPSYGQGPAAAALPLVREHNYCTRHDLITSDFEPCPKCVERDPPDVVGAPTALPTSAVARKMLPLATGLLDYFPAALVAVAGLSKIGNEQHNPGQPLHWARGKSGDEGDALVRHFIERGSYDTDGIRHSTKVAWRALALLQKELEEAGLAPLSRGSR